MPLVPGKATTVELRVGEQPRAVGGKAPELTLSLRVSKLADPADLAVTLNGKPLGTGSKAKTMIEYTVSPKLVTKGTNQIEVLLKPGSPAKASLVDLLLWVRYARKQ